MGERKATEIIGDTLNNCDSPEKVDTCFLYLQGLAKYL